MTRENGQLEAKRAVGRQVADMVEDGMSLGIGTGSTAAFAIEAIGKRIVRDHIRIVGVPTSYAAERLAREHGIPLKTLDNLEELDLAFDGADEVDPAYNLIKGRGAAHAREKVVASQARRFVVLVDSTKMVDVLGTRMPVPIEVIPMALGPVSRAVKRLGAEPVLRMGERKDGPVVTDQGLWLLDARFPPIEAPDDLDRKLNAIPGIVEHGLFVGMTTDLLVGLPDMSVRHERAER
ncbi:MAG: ribose-5-phosphate isomerase RpiA [Rhodothermia bacterium]|nr:ribose-5-phosphate isomerase RpiA [Rhodothermia bacterium]